MSDTLLVYNLCGIMKDNISKWQENIDAFLRNKDEFDLCISACNVSEPSKKSLKEKYKGHKITFIEDVLPVNVTFNFNCKLYPDYKYYVYTASDVNPNHHKNYITKIKNFHIENNNAMTGVHVSGDCLPPNFVHYERDLAAGKNITFKPGEAFNCHFCMFDGELMKHFKKCMPDIFRSWCTESVFYYVCESIGKRLGMYNSKEISFYHPSGSNDLDGNSSGFQEHKGPEDLFKSKLSAKERLMTKESFDAGFGYEEIKHLWQHNHSLYENDRPKDPQKLFKFIKTGVYLTDEEFNYNNIKHVRIN